MKIIRRNTQVSHAFHAEPADTVFDGEAIPREIMPQAWLQEGAVHRSRMLTRHLDSTRCLMGPQVKITRDDIRRTTWAGVVEGRRLMLCEVSGARPQQFSSPRFERKFIAEGEIWRYHLALNKFTGGVSVAWIARNSHGQRLFLDGAEIATESKMVDFPFLAYAQVPVGHIQEQEPAFGMLSYKCRDSGRVYVRRLTRAGVSAEVLIDIGPTVGGASLAIAKDRVLIRADKLHNGKITPVLIESTDGGLSFQRPVPIDLSEYDKDFKVAPGTTAPIVDKGYGMHAPVFGTSGNEAVALNYVLATNALVEAIRVPGGHPRGGLEVFPSTLGSKNTYGNGVSDGHGLIMVLETEGRLYSSNSSAGGIHFPEAALLNHEMPLIAAFDASECYSSGLRPNYVSMDYLYIEADNEGHPISPILHLETWDMPLPVPLATAVAHGSEVLLTVLNDADLEPGKVVFDFQDPAIHILDVKIRDLRHAVIQTDAKELAGKRLCYDVHTLFHRHFGEAVVDVEASVAAQ